MQTRKFRQFMIHESTRLFLLHAAKKVQYCYGNLMSHSGFVSKKPFGYYYNVLVIKIS